MRYSLALALATVCGAAAVSLAAQTPSPSDSALATEIKAMDDSLSRAYDAHDLEGLMALFAPDIEFYHDTQGLQHLAEVRAGFARLFARNNGISRSPVGPLEIYPVPNFGALEVGVHQFCHEESGRQDCGVFKFAMVWRREASGWKIARVISYGH